MKITMVASYPDQRLFKEIETLLKSGNTVELVLWDRGLSLPKVNQFRIKKFNFGSSYYGRLYAAFFIPFWWVFLFYSLLKVEQDVIHAVNFDTYLVSVVVTKMKKKKIVYDIFDFYAEMINIPCLNQPIRKIIKKIDWLLMDHADLIIIADKSRIRQLNTSSSIIIINNSPYDIYRDLQVDSEYQNKFKIYYGGQVVEQRGLLDIIRSVQTLEKVELIIMGYCHSPSYNKKLINESKDMKNVKLFLEAVNHDEIIKSTINSDLVIALYDPSIPNNKYASPNKLFEAMMCGKPIIVNKMTSLANIVNEEDMGIAINYGDVEAIKKAIIKIKDNKNLQNKFSNNARRAYEKKYNWSIMEKRLINGYKNLMINDYHET